MTPSAVRRLTDKGMTAAADWVHEMRTGRATVQHAAELARDTELTEIITDEVDLSAPLPDRRYEAAERLHELLDPLSQAGLIDPGTDANLWTWMSLHWAGQLVKPSDAANRVGEVARWLCEPSNPRRYYRHLLAGPYLTYSAHVDDPARTKVVLAGSLHTPGEAPGQFGATQVILSSPGLMEVARRLFWDDERDRLRPRTLSKNRLGTARRFSRMVRQLERTYDLEAMRADDILSLLEPEFTVPS